ncbi:MAG: O-antigen ligase family protein [Deltaproteobacteria bacterium]|nr:O-antigen ligase family protein [Deltaproteobacteria bacterium]MBW1993317.1 O-antigen ligase family protein [Deltaproteobacteria bacterium]MBW2150039.1 O-antigen ligase family protein [Deltaproteobacteria bacterium]
MPAPSEQHHPLVVSDLLILGILGTGTAVISFFGFQVHATILAGCVIAGLVILKRPEIGILFFLSTFLFSYPSFLRGIGMITPNNLLGLVFIFLLLERIFRKEGAWFLRVPQVQLLIGIGIVFLLSALFSKAPPEFMSPDDRTRKELWDFYTQCAFLVFMVSFIQTRSHLKAVYALLLFSVILTAVLALLFFVPTGGFSRAMAQGGIRMAKNSNHLAFYCLFGLVCSFYLLQETGNLFLKGTLGVLIMILLLVILLSASRNAFLNLLVFFGVVTFESGLELRKIMLILFLGGVLLLLAFNLVPKQHLDRITALQMDPTQMEASGSIRERKESLKIGLRIFLDSNPLLGVGPGNFRWIRQTHYDHKRVATHNAYLWAILSGGVPALVLYLLLFWTSLKDLSWMLRQKTEASLPPKWMVKTTRTVLLLFMVFSIFTESFLHIMPFFLIATTIIMKRAFLYRLQEPSTP